MTPESTADHSIQLSTSMSDRTRDLHNLVAQGKFLDALETFHCDRVVCEWNGERVVGLQANRQRLYEAAQCIVEWREYEVVSTEWREKQSLVTARARCVLRDGSARTFEFRLESTWRDDCIVHERIEIA